MKILPIIRRNSGLTRLEVMVIVLMLFVLALVLFPIHGRFHVEDVHSTCISRLKQTGLAFLIWEGDHNDKFPMDISVTNGGAMETAAMGGVVSVFRVMSNELAEPEFLVCPQDKYSRMATNFNNLTSSNISYFLNPNCSEDNPQEVMCGDDNFLIGGIPVKPGILTIASNTPIAWSAARHKFTGNLGLADGSAQGANNSGLNAYLANSLVGTNAMHLAIP